MSALLEQTPCINGHCLMADNTEWSCGDAVTPLTVPLHQCYNILVVWQNDLQALQRHLGRFGSQYTQQNFVKLLSKQCEWTRLADCSCIQATKVYTKSGMMARLQGNGCFSHATCGLFCVVELSMSLCCSFSQSPVLHASKLQWGVHMVHCVLQT